ncbi:glucokinase [Escherichia coli]|nr:glucokinase [Escherichia coli]
MWAAPTHVLLCVILPVVKSRRLRPIQGFDYPSLEAVIRVYLEEHKVEVKDGCIAIACPITGDWVAMTNHTWAFSIAEMKKNLGFSHLEIINDFTAVSMAIPMLKKRASDSVWWRRTGRR